MWDLSGEDEFQSVQLSYIRGAAGLLVVVDGTRGATAQTALELHRAALGVLGRATTVVVLNKSDLAATWAIDEATRARLRSVGVALVETSAKTGAGVEEAFGLLARGMLQADEGLARGVG